MRKKRKEGKVSMERKEIQEYLTRQEKERKKKGQKKKDMKM